MDTCEDCLTCTYLVEGPVTSRASINGPEERDDDRCAKGHNLTKGCGGESHQTGRPMSFTEYVEGMA